VCQVLYPIILGSRLLLRLVKNYKVGNRWYLCVSTFIFMEHCVVTYVYYHVMLHQLISI
jgi:hypothetical protein